MSRICQVTGKKPMTGNNRSHAMNATKRKFLPNIKMHKFWIPKQKRFIVLRVSTQGMRIINKKGIDFVLQNIFTNKKKKIEKYKYG